MASVEFSHFAAHGLPAGNRIITIFGFAVDFTLEHQHRITTQDQAIGKLGGNGLGFATGQGGYILRGSGKFDLVFVKLAGINKGMNPGRDQEKTSGF